MGIGVLGPRGRRAALRLRSIAQFVNWIELAKDALYIQRHSLRASSWLGSSLLSCRTPRDYLCHATFFQMQSKYINPCSFKFISTKYINDRLALPISQPACISLQLQPLHPTPARPNHRIDHHLKHILIPPRHRDWPRDSVNGDSDSRHFLNAVRPYPKLPHAARASSKNEVTVLRWLGGLEMAPFLSSATRKRNMTSPYGSEREQFE